MQETYLIYILSLFLTVGFAFLGVNYSKKKKQTYFKWNIYYILSILVLILVSGFRSENVGNDFDKYLEAYNYVLKHGSFFKYYISQELGWDYLNILFGKLHFSSILFFSLIALFIWYPFYNSLNVYFKLLPIVLFFIITDSFLFWSFSALRHTIAVTLFMFSKTL